MCLAVALNDLLSSASERRQTADALADRRALPWAERKEDLGFPIRAHHLRELFLSSIAKQTTATVIPGCNARMRAAIDLPTLSASKCELGV